MKNIIYMGTPQYAETILKALIEDKDINISLVVTQPDKKVGRKRVLTPPPVKVLALNNSIEVIQPNSLKDVEVIEKLKSLNPDLIVVAAYGQLLPKEVLDIAPCINLHASILPKYRGASPIQSAILNGDEYSGVTAMLMEEGLDTGDMLAYSFVKTKEFLRVDKMFEKLSDMAADLTIDVVKNFENLNPIKQLNALSSKCKKIKKEDGLVDFSNANTLFTKFNAYFGWPGIYLANGLKLLDIELVDSNSKNSEGEILQINQDDIIVGCKLGKIKIKELQPKSKSKMSAKAYIVGKRLKVGDKIL